MVKDYLESENHRNRSHADLYEDLIRRAFGKDDEVLIAHHLTFTREGEEPNEVPSADTLLFDHVIMPAVFGDKAVPLMVRLAQVPCEQREDIVREALTHVDA